MVLVVSTEKKKRWMEALCLVFSAYMRKWLGYWDLEVLGGFNGRREPSRVLY